MWSLGAPKVAVPRWLPWLPGLSVCYCDCTFSPGDSREISNFLQLSSTGHHPRPGPQLVLSCSHSGPTSAAEHTTAVPCPLCSPGVDLSPSPLPTSSPSPPLTISVLPSPVGVLVPSWLSEGVTPRWCLPPVTCPVTWRWPLRQGGHLLEVRELVLHVRAPCRAEQSTPTPRHTHRWCLTIRPRTGHSAKILRVESLCSVLGGCSGEI